MTILSAALIAIDLIICVIIAKVTSRNSQDENDYYLAGKSVGPVLLFLTAWASFSGAGNFIGAAGRGALYGISAVWAWAGETLCAGIVLATVLAPYLARFSYISMPHYIAAHLFGDDKIVRIFSGISAFLPNVIWPGAQIMGISYVMEQAFGIDYRIAVLICGAVLILHTTTGGIKAVIYADALHGIIQLIFAALVLFFGLRLFNFSFSDLGTAVQQHTPERWNLFVDRPGVLITSFLTGFVGALSSPQYWNRAFVAKDAKSARSSFGITFFLNIIMVLMITLIGVFGYTLNEEAGDQTLVWLLLNKMPPICAVILPVGVFASCMSCADTHLNCASANIVVDVIEQVIDVPGDKKIRCAKICTLISGIISIACGLCGDFIYGLGTYGYTVCGGVLIPLFVMGLITRDKDKGCSTLNTVAVRIGMILGIVVAVCFESIPSLYSLLSGGVIPAIAATVFGVLIPNVFLKNKSVPSVG